MTANDNQEREYYLNFRQALILCMLGNEGRCPEVRADIVAVIEAWRSGRLLDRKQVPNLLRIVELVEC
jgi:hypothetical protein